MRRHYCTRALLSVTRARTVRAGLLRQRRLGYKVRSLQRDDARLALRTRVVLFIYEASERPKD